MAVIIKSNKVATNNFGPISFLGLAPDALFSKYKARVVADGGSIRDEAYTKNLISKIYGIGMLGNLATYVSGKAGVKLDAAGGIDKLYALDGVDLKVYNEGNAAKPTLTPDNAIEFNGKSCFVTTEKQTLSKFGNFGVGLVQKTDVPSLVYGKPTDYLYSISNLTEKYLVAVQSYIVCPNEWGETFRTLRHPLNLETPSTLSDSLGVKKTASAPSKSVVFLSRPNDKLKRSYLNGAIVTTMSNDPQLTFSNLNEFKLHLTFGGVILTSGSSYAQGASYDFWFAKELTDSQASVLSS